MSDVVNFPAPDVRVWVCGCGCSTHTLNEDWTATCAMCGETVDQGSGGWYQEVKNGKAYDGDVSPIRDVQGNGSVEFARHLIAKRAQQASAKAICVIHQDGTISNWSDIETPEQRDWVFQRLEEYKALLSQVVADGPA